MVGNRRADLEMRTPASTSPARVRCRAGTRHRPPSLYRRRPVSEGCYGQPNQFCLQFPDLAAHGLQYAVGQPGIRRRMVLRSMAGSRTWAKTRAVARSSPGSRVRSKSASSAEKSPPKRGPTHALALHLVQHPDLPDLDHVHALPVLDKLLTLQAFLAVYLRPPHSLPAMGKGCAVPMTRRAEGAPALQGRGCLLG